MAKKKIQPKAYSQYDLINKVAGMNSPVLYKPVKYLEFSEGLKYATNMKGFALSSVFALIGGSDTGKTTTFMELIGSALGSDQLPVYIDKEGKFDYARGKMMGLPIDVIKYDLDTGEELARFEDDNFDEVQGAHVGMFYDQPFIVADDIFIRKFLEEVKGKLKGEKKTKNYTEIGSRITTKDLSNFMTMIIKKFSAVMDKFDKNGIVFLVDSYGRNHGEKFYEALDNEKQPENRQDTQEKNRVFIDFIETAVKRSKSSDYPFYITLGFIVNKYTFQASPNSAATGKPEGGDKRRHYTDYELYLGGKVGEGAKKETKAQTGDNYSVFNIVELEVKKNHGMHEITKDPIFITHHKGQICITPHGIIPSNNEAKDRYKKEHPELFGKIEDVVEINNKYEKKKK